VCSLVKRRAVEHMDVNMSLVTPEKMRFASISLVCTFIPFD
jgi:hypothetical protein